MRVFDILNLVAEDRNGSRIACKLQAGPTEVVFWFRLLYSG
jgi:hypothetical protein